MTILYFDCFAGISGDMTVAALLDLGVPLDYLRSELLKLPLPDGSYELSSTRTERHHLPALRFDVAVHDHHTHRHFAGIVAMIAESGLSDPVKERSRCIFLRLAEAEAKVHQVDIAEVHFHEVGAVDSIVDIVATAICLEYLGVNKVYAAPLPLGSGFVQTAHGRLPVPAPATVELLQGLAVHSNCGSGERVTPTGAAIVAALAIATGPRPAMTLTRFGSGAGGKDFEDCPNILRAFLGKPLYSPEITDDIIVVESNIDDSTAELLGYVMERLLDEGALDVFFTPIQMKKNRPATQLSFLCRQEHLDDLTRLLLVETSAIGLRYFPVGRIKMERRIATIQTCFGPVRFKQIFDQGHLLRSAPEYDDCRTIARERSIPLMEVIQQLAGQDQHSDTPL
ncbi:MAG TPA: nickel pincer cofactor biosynthesis protein LarC [Desulfuromonadales bacterium]|nr:nickel pincer cofactor biosynthesis protein LarC [Desulfuromonadales bacterium]